MWGFPKIRGTVLGVPIIGTIVFWWSISASPYLRNSHVGLRVLELGLRAHGLRLRV